MAVAAPRENRRSRARLASAESDICVVSEEQIQRWADEAEAGYDVEELKRRGRGRGRGRPGRGAEPMQVVAVRLTAQELTALNEVAEREHISRSDSVGAGGRSPPRSNAVTCHVERALSRR
jgi:hypothetical protein